MGQRFSNLKPRLKKTVKADFVISTKIIKEQFERLILLFMAKIKELLQTQLLLVIDALDKCEDKGHIKIILHFLARIQTMKFFKMRIFIISRSELLICLSFNKISDTYQDFILYEISKSVITHNILVFLRFEFAAIKNNYNLLSLSVMGLSLNWSYKFNLRALIIIAILLFIFAVIMCCFINNTD